MFFSLVHIFDLLEHLEDLVGRQKSLQQQPTLLTGTSPLLPRAPQAPHVCQLLDEAGEEMPQRYNAIHLG